MKNPASAETRDAVRLTEMGNKLAFTKKLQAVTNKIHATRNIDEIILEVSQDIRALFEAEQLTIYIISEDRQSVLSKRQVGPKEFKEIKIAINARSIVGYVALNKVTLNIADVYDDTELLKISPEIRFIKALDKQNGFRTKQILAFPIIRPDNGRLIGVTEVVNCTSGNDFSSVEDFVPELANTLAIAIRHRIAPIGMIKNKYGLLVHEGILSAEELESAQRSAGKSAKNLEEILITEYQVKPSEIGRSLSAFFGVPLEIFKADRIKPLDLLRKLKQSYVLSNAWIPIDETYEDGLVIMAPDPEMVKSSHIVSNIFPHYKKFSYRVCLYRDFANTVIQFYDASKMSDNLDEILSNMTNADEASTTLSPEVTSAANDNQLVKLVNKIIIDAHRQGASDIHIEPYPDISKTQVRFRKDGTLVNYIEIPPSYRNSLIARIKIMCDLDISERRKPQDGKIQFKKFGPLDIELRVATIPTSGGMEDVVMRILSAGKPIPLDNLYLSPSNNKKLKELITKPYGLFFVCGPTGSGKTTTLHSALGYINTPETKIWTAENPVEITQKGLRQVQVNKKAGLDFATIMKAFLRADPDVIMIGEMRDRETVSTCIEASLTGHLVFATLHTNSAPESIMRLLDIGMDPFNFADALLGILAQRLCKRLCDCKKAYTPDANEIKSMLDEYCEELKNTSNWKIDPEGAYKTIYQQWLKSFGNEKGQLTLYRPNGCEYCNSTGYKGRVGLHELLEGTDAMKRNIQEHARVAEMFATALEDGMRTLKQDGIEKVLQGITDMKQVRTVCIK